MSQSYETFISLTFKQEHWELVLNNRGAIKPQYSYYQKYIDMIHNGIKPQTKYQETHGLLTSEFRVHYQDADHYYNCLGYFNLPYTAFENEGWQIQWEIRFDPQISPYRKKARVLGRPGNYFLDHRQLQDLATQTPDSIQRIIEETLNPFKNYPDLTQLKQGFQR